MGWFTREVQIREFKVVEVERPSPALDWSKEEQSAIASLSGHPGFEALMRKFRLQRSMLETQLRTKHHMDIRAVDSLQAAISWASYFERQVKEQVLKRSEKPPRMPLALEEEEFARVSKALEIVGKSGS